MLDFFISPAMAQAGGQQGNGLMSFVPFIAVFAIFYFLMIRPQKKKMVEEQKMIQALGKGDEVFTKSGILGTITGLTDRIITLEIAENVKIKVLRTEVAGASKKFLGDDAAKK